MGETDAEKKAAAEKAAAEKAAAEKQTFIEFRETWQDNNNVTQTKVHRIPTEEYAQWEKDYEERKHGNS